MDSKDDMSAWRRFERSGESATDVWWVRQQGIRCFFLHGAAGSTMKADLSVRDDEQEARHYAEVSVKEKLEAGYVETLLHPEELPPSTDTNAQVVDVLQKASQHYALEYQQVDGFNDIVCHHFNVPKNPLRAFFYEYLLLSSGGRRALRLFVFERYFEQAAIKTLLDFASAHRELPFLGQAHHKLPLGCPVGMLSHALLCSPALGRAAAAYPVIADSVASFIPIFDVEIGDHDTEVLVDARIHGRNAIPTSQWDRAAYPVIDLRFDIRAKSPLREEKFRVYGKKDLVEVVDRLRTASPESWVEVRSSRSTIKRLRSIDVNDATIQMLEEFLHA